MAKPSKTRYAILGMLTIHAMSGYEIKKHMADSTDYFWSESNGQLYPTLAKLSDEGLVSCTLEMVGAKPKKVYDITPSGREALETWLAETPDDYPKRNELLLKVFFGQNASTEVTLKHLKAQLKKCNEVLETFCGIQKRFLEKYPEMPLEKRFSYATLLYGIKACELEKEWCHETINLFTTETTGDKQ